MLDQILVLMGGFQWRGLLYSPVTMARYHYPTTLNLKHGLVSSLITFVSLHIPYILALFWLDVTFCSLQVWQMEWDVSGMTLATTGSDGVVRLWQSNLNGTWDQQALLEPTA